MPNNIAFKTGKNALNKKISPNHNPGEASIILELIFMIAIVRNTSPVPSATSAIEKKGSSIA
jgi:hypothetical protein